MKNNYKEFRKKWARENTELFLNTLKKVGEETGVEITPLMYVRAYKLCIEKYEFGYPSEFKVTELISTEETYEQTLAIMAEIIKRFRLAFWKVWKQNRKAARRRQKKVA